MAVSTTTSDASGKLDAPALVDAILNESAGASEAFVQQFAPGLLAMFHTRIGDRALAEDMCQECLATAWQQIRDGALREPQALAAYIHSIATRILNRGISQQIKDRELQAQVALGGQVESLPDIWHEAYEKELRERIVEWLRQLPGRDGDILWRHFFTRQTKDEIAAEHGISGSHYDVLLHRAKKKLKRIIEDCDDEF